MIIIGFAKNTSKLLPRIFCRSPRHCAPIVRVRKNQYIMYQFVRRGTIAQISLNSRAIRILGAHGWQFVSVKSAPPRNFMRRARHAHSCVALCKYAIGIYALSIPYIIIIRCWSFNFSFGKILCYIVICFTFKC